VEVFITWSGSRARHAAEFLCDWLPNVIQALRPFMSSQMAKGIEWPEELSARLTAAKAGILVLTPENWTEPWVLFEAGRLMGGKRRVMPLLLGGLQVSDIGGSPLSDLQAASKPDKSEVRALLNSLNDALGERGVNSEQLKASLDAFWGEFEAALVSGFPPPPADSPPAAGPTVEESLETMSQTLHTITRRLNYLFIAEAARRGDTHPPPGPPPPNLLGGLFGSSAVAPSHEDAVATMAALRRIQENSWGARTSAQREGSDA